MVNFYYIVEKIQVHKGVMLNKNYIEMSFLKLYIFIICINSEVFIMQKKVSIIYIIYKQNIQKVTYSYKL